MALNLTIPDWLKRVGTALKPVLRVVGLAAAEGAVDAVESGSKKASTIGKAAGKSAEVAALDAAKSYLDRAPKP